MSFSAFRLLLVLVVPSVALSGCLVGGYTYDYHVSFETEETNRIDLDAAGQTNCVDAAQNNEPHVACPLERAAAVWEYPALGILILDAFHLSAIPAEGASQGGQRRPTDASPDAFVDDFEQGSNLHRATGGLAPNVIWPGPGYIGALLGHWDNQDLDGDVDLRIGHNESRSGAPYWGHQILVTNEWAGQEGSEVVAYIEPGDHPQATARVRPDAYSPDVRFTPVYYRGGSPFLLLYRSEGINPIVFLDGSLATPMTITTVSDAFLAPDARGHTVYTPKERTRVDIDRYAALAPGPLEPIYKNTVAPVLGAIGSPSLGSCPNGCRIAPIAAPGTPLAPLQKSMWANDPREWAEGSGNSAAGRHHEFEVEYRAWVDLLPRWSAAIPSNDAVQPQNMPLVRNPDGTATVPPGHFNVEVWSGIWKDLDGDGFIGTASSPDPYEEGTRPNPDSYERARGEFFGIHLGEAGQNPEPFFVVLVPDTLWGPGVHRTTTGVPQNRNESDDTDCPDPVRPQRFCTSKLANPGSTPIRLEVSAETVVKGYHNTRFTVFFPEGSPGFTVCTPALPVVFDGFGIRLDEDVWDCDPIAKWQG
ncbi:MAG TPA: hypothetical protein VM889_10910 [Candidatus Thermoplasmatota archaeon]|nr:hypothetical protein [Candidatus Thermoplasmatota archaeon]